MDKYDELLKRLTTWEQRTDHDLGPGLAYSDVWIRLFPDGSGELVVELNTVVDSLDEKANRLFTVLGLKGQLHKKFMFEDYNGAVDILSRPLKLDVEHAKTLETDS